MRANSRVLWSLGGLLAALVLLAAACGPPRQDQAAASDGRPEITEETIRDRINGAFVRQVPEENGAAEPMTWVFFGNEPKEISVVEKQVNGDHATIVLDVKTESGKRTRNKRSLAGRIRTEWQLESGWALRRRRIVDIENISMKYRNLPKTEPAESPGSEENEN